MRIGTSRADRLGFVVFAVLAGLLAVLVVANLNNDPTESAQSVNTLADIAPPAAVPTTEAVSMPEPTPTPEPLVIAPAAEPETEDADEADEPAENEADDASTADGDADDAGTSQAASPAASSSEASPAAVAAPAETAEAAVPNPQPAASTATEPAATEVPNPQPAAGAEAAVPNPQPAASAVPNPQPANPQAAVQPVSAAPASVPADAPAGGTFTHTLTSAVARPTLHTSAGGAVFTPTFNGTALPAVHPTVFGNPLVYRVLAGEPGDQWAKVYVPARPNGTTAWVQTSQFNWGSSNRMLQINITNRTVTVFEGSNVLLTTAAVLGKSSSPTPRASGWVEEVMAGPSAAYGPQLISLGIFSDALNSFGGSVPKIALHGTNNPGLIGQYASNGCIRVPNDIINQIVSMMPVGSKVVLVG